MKRGILLVTLCFFAAIVFAQEKGGESELKAAFIYNFTKYVDWDSTDTESYFTIGVIGSTPVTETLNQIASTRTVNNKRIQIRNFNKPEEINYCNILFIPHNIPFSLESILNRVGKGVLTISEESGFAKMGTAFNFVIKNDKLKFEANLKTINSQGLKASSQLLKLATIVDYP
ncbi:MAG TPA: YfiR family protein [Chitinophagaceae bacterium]|nr:YfiR family protein [Chitinophagaceae bacterium]